MGKDLNINNFNIDKKAGALKSSSTKEEQKEQNWFSANNTETTNHKDITGEYINAMDDLYQNSESKEILNNIEKIKDESGDFDTDKQVSTKSAPNYSLEELDETTQSDGSKFYSGWQNDDFIRIYKNQDGAQTEQIVSKFQNEEFIDTYKCKYSEKSGRKKIETFKEYGEDNSVKEFCCHDKIKYDKNGNITQKRTTSYSFDEKGNLKVSINKYKVSYDKDGNEVLKVEKEYKKKAALLEKAYNNKKINEQEMDEILGLMTGNMSISETSFVKDLSKLDFANKIAFGEPKEKGENGKSVIQNKLQELTKKYNVNFYIDNDTVTDEYAKAHNITNGKVLSMEAIDYLESSLEEMKEHNQKLPENAYIINMNYGGYFSPNVQNSVFLNAELTNSQPEFTAATLQHEAAHMADFDPETGESVSSFDSETMLTDNEGCTFSEQCKSYIDSENKYTDSDITNMIDNYVSCKTNTEEYVAVVTQMITSGIIVQKEDGSYTVDSKYQGKPLRDECKNWEGSKEDVEGLNVAMKLYSYLTKENMLATPKKIG